MSEAHQIRAWRTLSARILLQRPICQDPFGYHARQGEVVPATEVHHIKPVETFPELLLDTSNLLSLCPLCHKAIHRKSESVATIAKGGVKPAQIIQVITSGGSPIASQGVGGALTFASPSYTAPCPLRENAQRFEKGGTPPAPNNIKF